VSDGVSDGIEIVARGLTKVYRSGVVAATDISFRVGPGEIVGVVGPNGAGKSTTLNMVATLTAPTSGTATVCGIPVERSSDIRPLIGVALQEAGLDPLLSVRGHFEVQAAMYRVDRGLLERRFGELVDRFDLGRYVAEPAGALSGGTQRRLSLALALVHDPRVVIFDEPSAGLDPFSRRRLWEVLKALANDGRAILFSTHYLDEADALCRRLLLIDRGSVVAQGSPSDLKASVGPGSLRIGVAQKTESAAAILRKALSPNSSKSSRASYGAPSVVVDGDEIVVLPPDSGANRRAGRAPVERGSPGRRQRPLRAREPKQGGLRMDHASLTNDILSCLAAAKLEVVGFEWRVPTLDDAFLAYAGHPPSDPIGTRPVEVAVALRQARAR